MLSTTARIASSRMLLARPTGVAISQHGCRMMSIGSDLSKKEKVEEDRYIRQKEYELYMVRKAEEEAKKAAVFLSEEAAAAKAEHDSAVSEIFGVLAKTGDKLSDSAIENLASWKLGH